MAPLNLSRHSLLAGILCAQASLSLTVFATAQSIPVPTPPGWYSGDAHVHLQQCDTPTNMTMQEIYLQMVARDLDVAAVQLWCSPWTTPDYYMTAYSGLVTGVEDPHSTADRKLQIGIEVSGFDASQFGHVQILGAHNGWFPMDALYPGPILAYDSDALNGYAHVSWKEDYSTVPFYGGLNGAYMAPIDAALGAIDFIETTRVLPDAGMEKVTWRGLYYKLLNAGLRVSLAAGSDNSCFITEIGDSRTYARLESGPLSFAGWSDAIRAGRTSVAAGRNRFIDLEVEGRGIGSQIELGQPGVVNVKATLSIASGISDAGTLSIMRDGVEAASIPYSLPTGGTVTLQAAVPMETSGWLAARGDPGSHTGAVYVIVGDKPIGHALDAQYWVAYCDAFSANIGSFDVPAAQSEILARIRVARQVFAALASCDLPPPVGVATYGLSTFACKGPIAIGVGAQRSSQPLTVTCVNAPPGAPGLLILGQLPEPAGVPIMGCSLLIKENAPHIKIPVTANDGGFANVPIPLPSGKPFSAQFVWLNEPGCGTGGLLCASNAISVDMP